MAGYMTRSVPRSAPTSTVLSSQLLSDFTFRMLTRSYKSHPERFSPNELLDRPQPYSVRQLQPFLLQLISSVSASKAVVMASLVYHNRLRTFHGIWLQRQPISLAYTACLMLAFKFIEDQPVYARSWASASGLSLTSINDMEREVLYKFSFGLYVNESTLSCYLHQATQFYSYQRNLYASPYPKFSYDRQHSSAQFFQEESGYWPVHQTKPAVPWSRFGPPPGLNTISDDIASTWYPSLPLPQLDQYGTDFIHAIPYYSPHYTLPL